MTKDSFYLHEDDWAMINIMPAENPGNAEEVAKEARTFSQEHLTVTHGRRCTSF